MDALSEKRRRSQPSAIYIGLTADGRVCGCYPVRRNNRRVVARWATAILAAGGRVDCLFLPGRSLASENLSYA
jgi:hypothetical protein